MQKRVLIYLILCVIIFSCHGQKKPKEIVGGGCDGCELMYVDMPKNILNADTSDAWNEHGQKLAITGKVFKKDGRTPAENVIIYYWQTDQSGLYASDISVSKKAKRHGRLRGWVKTDRSGKYSIYTTRPAPYPNEKIPAHIHLSIKEPNINEEYYIDDLVFDDDLLLTSQIRKSLENRGGSGVLRVLLDNDLQVAEHNIILGLNIPNYPHEVSKTTKSGLAIGEDQPSFIPFHAYGADKGTRTCPVCKYGRYHGVIYFVGHNPNWDEIEQWLTFLDQEGGIRKDRLKTYFVYGNDQFYVKASREKELDKLGSKLKLKNIALTFVPSFSDVGSEVYLNKIDPEIENTFILYKNRNIVEKFINFEPNQLNFKRLISALDQSQGTFFDLSTPLHH